MLAREIRSSSIVTGSIIGNVDFATVGSESFVVFHYY